MSTTESNARKMLCTIGCNDFFGALRAALRRAGLAEGELKFGIGFFFVLVSRFMQNPLRLYVNQKSKGNAKYLLLRVAQLLAPGTVIPMSGECDKAWSRFENAPAQRVVFIPPWDELAARASFDVRENQLTRSVPVVIDGRDVDKCETVEGSFACISGEYPDDLKNRPRWLRVNLPKPPWQGGNRPTRMTAEDRVVWFEIQKLIQKRAQLRILLPPWEELVVEKVCVDPRAHKNVPAFLQCWKIMTVLRSFGSHKEKDVQRGVLRADIEDFAATAAVMKVFREGRWFPSPQYIFKKVSREGDHCYFIHPLTGKGVKYTHDPEPEPEQGDTLFGADELSLYT